MLSNRPINSLQEILMAFIEKSGLHEEYELSQIMNNWAELVGEKFAQESTPETLKDGVLHVKTKSSVWRAELFYRREQIIDKINEFRDKLIVKEMVIR